MVSIFVRVEIRAALIWDTPSTVLRRLCFHNRALNGLPRYLCVPDLERECFLLDIEPPFYTYTQQLRNLAFAIRKCTKNMVSIFTRVGICAALFSVAMNYLPPTPFMTLPVRRHVIRPSFVSIADRRSLRTKDYSSTKSYTQIMYVLYSCNNQSSCE